jgi:hypothetical protein
MSYRRDITGLRSGRLVALYLGEPLGPRRLRAWVCQCDCGKTSTVNQAIFILGRTRSCGCLSKENHFRGPQPPHKMTPEGIKGIAEAAKRPERRAKISHAMKGRTSSEETKLKLSAVFRSRASALSYKAAHKRVYRDRGAPSLCEHCGTTDGKFQWANISDRFDDVMDYARLCAKCHAAFDPERWPKAWATRRGEKQPEVFDSTRIVMIY